MNVLIGLVGLAAVFSWVARPGNHDSFQGLLHLPALVLVGAGPLFVALISFRLDDLRDCGRVLGAAFGISADGSRRRLYDELSRYGIALREGRAHVALEVAQRSQSPMLRKLGALAVRQHGADALQKVATTFSQVETSRLRRAESVLTALSRIAPAMGLVGTVLGLVMLLKDLAQFERLGPSMALAMLCTLYGLLLANGLYQPLSRRIGVYAALRAEEDRLVARALAVAHEERGAAELLALFEGEAAEAASTAAPVAGGSA